MQTLTFISIKIIIADLDRYYSDYADKQSRLFLEQLRTTLTRTSNRDDLAYLDVCECPEYQFIQATTWLLFLGKDHLVERMFTRYFSFNKRSLDDRFLRAANAEAELYYSCAEIQQFWKGHERMLDTSKSTRETLPILDIPSVSTDSNANIPSNEDSSTTETISRKLVFVP